MFLLNRIKFRPFAKRQNSPKKKKKKKTEKSISRMFVANNISAHLFVSHQSLLPAVCPKTTKRHGSHDRTDNLTLCIKEYISRRS